MTEQIRQAIFHALGRVSMCWNPIPVGTPDDAKILAIGETLYQQIAEEMSANDERLATLHQQVTDQNTALDAATSTILEQQKCIAEQHALLQHILTTSRHKEEPHTETSIKLPDTRWFTAERKQDGGKQS